MTGPADCQILGRWRIVESDIRDDGTLKIELAFDDGDDTVLAPRRE